MPIFTRQGTALYYEIHGQGEPLVFLNGIMMTVDSWVFQKKFFHHDYQCVFHDFRDQLRSGPHPAPYDMSIHAADLLALLDHLQIDRAHLIGTSYGGEVALIFASTYPERVQSLTVIASVSHSRPLLQLQVGVWKKAALQAPHLLYEALAGLSFSDDFLQRMPGLVRAGKERIATHPPDFYAGFARLCDAFLQLNITDRLAGIQCPTLVIAAEQDILKTPAYSRVIHRGIPHSELAIIPNAGHAVVLEQPEAINQKISSFLGSTG